MNQPTQELLTPPRRSLKRFNSTATPVTAEKQGFSMRRITSSIMMMILWLVMIVFVVIKSSIGWLKAKLRLQPTSPEMGKSFTYKAG